MISVLVWGAPGLPEIVGDHQGVDLVKVADRRIKTALFAVATTLLISVFAVPMASGAAQNSFVFDAQPQDAEVGETITSSDLLEGTSFVKVRLVDEANNTVLNDKILVTFVLDRSPGSASGTLQVTPQPLIAGVATFGPGTLRILTENEPQFTGYRLIPRTTKNPIVTGPASDPFDIWEDGESCGAGETCDAFLRGADGDHYELNAAGTLGASQLPASLLPGLVCPGQAVVFQNSVFSYATTQGNQPATHPVKLTNHITKAEWQASANNGQAHADWCIGLTDPWTAVGGPAVQKDTDGIGGADLYVGLAPKCPSQNPSGSAPCIVSQTGDGKGGSTSIGWLPGGDPPRRT
jgi:hypothetical protein